MNANTIGQRKRSQAPKAIPGADNTAVPRGRSPRHPKDLLHSKVSKGTLYLQAGLFIL
jgi:hypothetical protein